MLQNGENSREVGVENLSECGLSSPPSESPLSCSYDTLQQRREVGVGCFLLRHLDLREPSLTQFTEDGERENEGGVDDKREWDEGYRQKRKKIRCRIALISSQKKFDDKTAKTHGLLKILWCPDLIISWGQSTRL